MPEVIKDPLERLIIAIGQRLTALVEIHQAQLDVFGRIESHLSRLAIAANPAPNFRKPLREFPDFDWSAIGAKVLGSDKDGASAVEWNGMVFTRRSPSNKFDVAIWFSRAVGKDEAGNNKYERLITFNKPSEADEIPKKVAKELSM